MVGSQGKIGNFMCRNCIVGGVKVVDEVKQFVLGNNDKMEVVEKFCYLGDVIGKEGGAEESSIARVRCAWGKFMDLKMLLTEGSFLESKRKDIQSVCTGGAHVWKRNLGDEGG